MGVKTAEFLCEAGDNVILASRNEDRGKLIVEKIKAKNPQALVHFLPLDLCNRESIEKFAESFREMDKKLTVLINNAGVLLGFKDTKRQMGSDGFEKTLSTNYFGPWLLTHLLLEDLKKTASENEEKEARIINVVCAAHDHTASRKHNLKELDAEDLALCKEGVFNGGQAYKDSKAAMVMFTYELAKQLEGSNVSVNAVCPGFVPATALYRSCPVAQRYFNKWIMGGMLRFLKAVTTPDKAAESVFELAHDEKHKGVTGKYFLCKKESESSEETRNEEKQKTVWAKTGGYWKLDGFEPLEIPTPPPEPEPEVKKEKEEEKKEEEEGDEKEKEEKEAEEKKQGTDDEKEKETEKEGENLVVEEKEPEDKAEKIEEVAEK